VVEKSQLRALLAAAGKINEIVHEAGDIASKINQAQAEVMRLSEKSAKSEPKSIREVRCMST
jgi:replicative DNA helicase